MTQQQFDSNVLLRLSACTDTQQISELLTEAASLKGNPLAVLTHIPECIDPQQLADTIFGLTLADDGYTKGTIWLASEHQKWAQACVGHAESIDRWTGRLDWAVTWLQATQEWLQQLLPDQTDVELISHALRNAQLLDQVISQTSIFDNGYSLEELNAMELEKLVNWVMEIVSENEKLAAPLTDTLCSSIDIDSNLFDAWNDWWLQNNLGGDMLAGLLKKYPRVFTNSVILAAIYSVGGACSHYDHVSTAIASLAGRLKDSKYYTASTIELSSDIRDRLLSSTIQSFTEDDLVKIASVAQVQIEAVSILDELGLDMDMPAIVASQGDASAQRRLLIKLLAGIHTAIDEVSLWKSLLRLSQIRVLGELQVDEIKQEYLRSLLSNEQFEEAEMLVDAEPRFTNQDIILQTVCEAARELYDNAESGNMDKGMVLAARKCLDVLPMQFQGVKDVQRERALIEAAHLVWTLTSTSTGVSIAMFKSSTSSLTGGTPTGEEVLPIEIRLAKDPYDLLALILERTSGAYKKQRIVREVAMKLIGVFTKEAEVRDGSSGDSRDLKVNTVSDALVTALMLCAATNCGDFTSAYNFARQLLNSRQLLTKAMQKAEKYQSTQLLATDSDTRNQQIEVRAIEAIWTVCSQLAQMWWDSEEQSVVEGNNEKILDVLSLALSLCPTSKIEGLLEVWNAVQSTAATPETGIIDISEILMGSKTSTVDEQKDAGGVTVAPESMRTFDVATIRGCLRQAGTANLRCDLMLEWLEFAMTTVKEPNGEQSLAYCKRMEAGIVQKYADRACKTLADRVWPQLDQMDYQSLQTFFEFYAQCLESCGENEKSEQAQARIKILAESSGIQRDIGFADLVRIFTLPSKEKCQELAEVHLNTMSTTMSLVRLVAWLAQLRAILPFDGGEYRDAVGWEEEELTSKLCLWFVLRQLEQRVMDPQVVFAECLPYIRKLPDLSTLCHRVTFYPAYSMELDPECRNSVVSWCFDFTSESRTIQRCHAYMDFITKVGEIRDPFTFARLPEQWVSALGKVAADETNTAESIGKCGQGDLVDMVVAEVPSFFVFQSYVHVRELVEKWEDGGSPMCSLSEVYSRALDRVLAAEDMDDERGVVGLVEPPLELCSFDYGEGMLSQVLAQFKSEFTERLSEMVHGQQSSSVKLALLDILNRYSSDPIDNIGVSDKECLQFQLLADKHWGKKIDISERTVEALGKVWKDLLELTDAQLAVTNEQVDTLIMFLVGWGTTEDDKAGIADCWYRLLKWSVVNGRTERMVVALCGYPEQFGKEIGERLFEELAGHLEWAPSLAVVGLAYPDQNWAEQCLEPVIHVMLSPSETEEEDEDAWGIDDALGDNEETTGADPDPDLDLDRVRSEILNNVCLHLAIMRRGYVSACVASPELLTALGTTLLHRRSEAEVNEMLYGVTVHELFRRTVHTMYEIGMEAKCMEWIYEYLEVPRLLRYAVSSKQKVERWLRQVDSVVQGKDQEEEEEEEDVGWGEEVEL